MEGILDLVGLAMAVYAARGTARYEDLRKQLPEEYQDSYHKVIQVKVNIDCDFLQSRHNWCKYLNLIWAVAFHTQMGAQYVITIFLAQRSIESMAQLNVGDLVWEESDTVVFSYYREVFV